MYAYVIEKVATMLITSFDFIFLHIWRLAQIDIKKEFQFLYFYLVESQFTTKPWVLYGSTKIVKTFKKKRFLFYEF